MTDVLICLLSPRGPTGATKKMTAKGHSCMWFSHAKKRFAICVSIIVMLVLVPNICACFLSTLSSDERHNVDFSHG